MDVQGLRAPGRPGTIVPTTRSPTAIVALSSPAGTKMSELTMMNWRGRTKVTVPAKSCVSIQ